MSKDNYKLEPGQVSVFVSFEVSTNRGQLIRGDSVLAVPGPISKESVRIMKELVSKTVLLRVRQSMGAAALRDIANLPQITQANILFFQVLAE